MCDMCRVVCGVQGSSQAAGVFITKVRGGGCSEGKLMVGDHIVAVNGHLTKDSSYKTVRGTLCTGSMVTALLPLLHRCSLSFAPPRPASCSRWRGKPLPPYLPTLISPQVRVPALLQCTCHVTVTCAVSVAAGESFVVELEKERGALGLRIAGGNDKLIGRGFVRIKQLTATSAASKSGRLREGDIILQVHLYCDTLWSCDTNHQGHPHTTGQ